MRETEYSRLGQTVIADELDNGLRVLLLPKPGFRQVFAGLTTAYGSVDTAFKSSPAAQLTQVPDGIAHFLEHKMFESQHGDVFAQYAQHGASPNAFTSFDQTTYHFSCTEDVFDNVRILLDCVQDPYFTDDNIEKEKGIINQEIRMYDDNPDQRSYFNLLQGLFQDHPVRMQISGTVESIAGIDKELLYHCYRTFYHPSNMWFVATGGFDPHALLDLIRENQAQKSFAARSSIVRVLPQEQPRANRPRTTVELSVSQPSCLVGWKDAETGLNGQDMLVQELLTGILLDVLFGRSSETYHQLVDAGLTDNQFSWEYEVSPTYGYTLIGGNTPDPDALQARIEATLQHAMAQGLAQDEFVRGQRKAVGRFLTALDSPGYLGRCVSSYALKDTDYLQTLPILESITLADVNRRLQALFSDDAKSVSIVLPQH